jgi:hypothetical protein
MAQDIARKNLKTVKFNKDMLFETVKMVYLL